MAGRIQPFMQDRDFVFFRRFAVFVVVTRGDGGGRGGGDIVLLLLLLLLLFLLLFLLFVVWVAGFRCVCCLLSFFGRWLKLKQLVGDQRPRLEHRGNGPILSKA